MNSVSIPSRPAARARSARSATSVMRRDPTQVASPTRPPARPGAAALTGARVSRGAMALPSPAPDGTVLITGASSGLGREFARRLATRGHGVTLVARREERLRELAAELAGSHGVRAESLSCDLTDTDQRDALGDRVA